jgi:predicted membrane channel-forming protein YqfA (hemolysin III family)
MTDGPLPATDAGSKRRLLGTFILIFGLTVYCFAVAILADVLGPKPWWADILLFVVAGVAWVFPCKPLLRWMQTGRWSKADA